MKRFKKILLYAGGEVDPAPALERAAALAHANGGRLTIMDVLPEESTVTWMSAPEQSGLDRALAKVRSDELEILARSVRERGVEVDSRVSVGRPFVALIGEVQRHGYDLVMKTAQGESGSLGGVFGSTALHLFRKCPSPVWVVKADAVPRGSILAAVDPNLEDPAKDTLSRAVLELASSLARARKIEMNIVHAYWLSSESMLRGPRFNMASEAVDEIIDRMRRSAAEAVERLLELVDLTDVVYRVHIEYGRPFQVISEFSKRSEVAVLGTLSRAGIAGVLIGNTAEAVLRQVDCSVLAVKPDGFVSPVRLPDENP
jgi:nucleotide-binding universal stress UspA family protein